ncbi:hypothetical protein V502_02243 [Pseudogymnoascus sp. VKM F-4520 (FW-2644)]|nr:hypothetical protein V502_02243 [Pseudogymnoascus sp. VKM F-4520 (FW-2644)]
MSCRRASLHIAVINCDTPVPHVLAARGLCSDIFASLLRRATEFYADWKTTTLVFTAYDAVKGELPLQQDLEKLDGLLLSGSTASAYDPTPWVVKLASFLTNTYHNNPSVRLFGSCFGHQIICHAIFSYSSSVGPSITLPSPSSTISLASSLSPLPSVVSQDPKGWKLGLHDISLSPQFLSHFGPVPSNPASPSQMRLRFTHADHVILPSLPSDFLSVGRSEHCALQGVYKTGRVLTFQGHPEYDEWINIETITSYGATIWTEEVLQEALEKLKKGEDDNLYAARVMLDFLVEEAAEQVDAAGKIEMLLDEKLPMAVAHSHKCLGMDPAKN